MIIPRFVLGLGDLGLLRLDPPIVGPLVCVVSCPEMHEASPCADQLLLGVHGENLLINACITLTNSGSSNPSQREEGGTLFNKELPVLIYFEWIDLQDTEQESGVALRSIFPSSRPGENIVRKNLGTSVKTYL